MLSQRLRYFFTAFVDLIYPPACIICGENVDSDEPPACRNCIEKIEFLCEPLCSKCGFPIREWNNSLLSCTDCPNGDIHFDKARSLVSYSDENVRTLIHGLKYEFQTSLAVPLGELMLKGFDRYYGNFSYDAIVPVPLHRSRLREREFNQSSLISAQLAKSKNIPLREDLVIRKKRTVPQVKLEPQKRRTNLLNVFEIGTAEFSKNSRILIVDDVYTTGSTVNELCGVLKRAGVKTADVLTLARAV